MQIRRSQTWGAGFKTGAYSLGMESGAAFRLLAKPSSTFEELKTTFSSLKPPQKHQLLKHPQFETLLQEKHFSRGDVETLKSILTDTAVNHVQRTSGDSLDHFMATELSKRSEVEKQNIAASARSSASSLSEDIPLLVDTKNGRMDDFLPSLNDPHPLPTRFEGADGKPVSMSVVTYSVCPDEDGKVRDSRVIGRPGKGGQGNVSNKIMNSVAESHFHGKMTGIQLDATGTSDHVFISDIDGIFRSGAEGLFLEVNPRFEDDQMTTGAVIEKCDRLKLTYSGLNADDRASMEMRDDLDIRVVERSDRQVMGELLKLLEGGSLTEEAIKLANKSIQESVYNTERHLKSRTEHGDYRDVPAMVGPTMCEHNDRVSIAAAMNSLLEKVNQFVDKEHSTEKTIRAAASVHTRLISIHPFGNGNGRVARVLMNYILVKGGLPPVPINHNQRAYKAVASVASFGSIPSSSRDASGPNNRILEDYIARCVLRQLSG